MPDLTQAPETGHEIRKRLRTERLAADSRYVQGRFALRPALWALIGSAVVLYLFLVAVGGVEPGDAPAATTVILVAAVLWLAHAWRRVLRGGVSPRGDRERRGF